MPRSRRCHRRRFGLVLRVSYLLYRLIADKAAEAEGEEFWRLLQIDAPVIEQEWLELSGLTSLRQKEPSITDPNNVTVQGGG